LLKQRIFGLQQRFYRLLHDSEALGDNSLPVYLSFSAGMFVYGLIIFTLLKKFHNEDNTTAFIITFCLSSLIKGFVLGWG